MCAFNFSCLKALAGIDCFDRSCLSQGLRRKPGFREATIVLPLP